MQRSTRGRAAFCSKTCNRTILANEGRDVHLAGGPQMIETFRALGALEGPPGYATAGAAE
jgi:hypothetical protein